MYALKVSGVNFQDGSNDGILKIHQKLIFPLNLKQ